MSTDTFSRVYGQSVAQRSSNRSHQKIMDTKLFRAGVIAGRLMGFKADVGECRSPTWRTFRLSQNSSDLMSICVILDVPMLGVLMIQIYP